MTSLMKGPFRKIFRERSNEVKITERAVRLELSLQHRPDAILNLGGLFHKNLMNSFSENYKQ